MVPQTATRPRQPLAVSAADSVVHGIPADHEVVVQKQSTRSAKGRWFDLRRRLDRGESPQDGVARCQNIATRVARALRRSPLSGVRLASLVLPTDCTCTGGARLRRAFRASKRGARVHTPPRAADAPSQAANTRVRASGGARGLGAMHAHMRLPAASSAHAVNLPAVSRPPLQRSPLHPPLRRWVGCLFSRIWRDSSARPPPPWRRLHVSGGALYANRSGSAHCHL